MSSGRTGVFNDKLATELTGTFRRVLIGLGIAIFGAAVQFVSSSSLTTAAAMTLGIVGVIIAGLAIAQKPTDSRILGFGALTALAAVFSAHPDWGAVRMMLAVQAAIAGVAAILFLLSSTARKIVVSALVIFHFCGIISAITSPPPTPWLTSQFWVRIFRPHLEFCYSNNAYQFYSPEPGPANILWFCIQTEDSPTPYWIKIPDTKTEVYDPLGTEYYRRLSITERANGNEYLPSGPPPEAYVRRNNAIANAGIPMHPEAVPAMQFRMPDENARQFLASYARHIAKTEMDKHPGVHIKSIKVYLTQHRLLSQRQYADHEDPYDKSSYLPFFVGEYDTDGKLVNPFDPMLFWVVPIIKTKSIDPATGKEVVRYDNYMIGHAGSDPFEAP
jgi:hypothetical protein